jgi:hypothetical protein
MEKGRDKGMKIDLARLAVLSVPMGKEASISYSAWLGPVFIEPIRGWKAKQRIEVLLMSRVELKDLPALSDDNLSIVPDEPRRLSEAAIEAYANTVAVLERCHRSISSPANCVGFLPGDEEARAWLRTVDGISAEGSSIVWIRPRVDIGFSASTDAMRDRLDGLALMVEALSHRHPSGSFHEYVRFFERAFTRSSSLLVEPLTRFLEGAGMLYTGEEVRNWVVEMRHPATHADCRPDFLLAADIGPVLPRMEQAAYDVLFNKAEWGNATTQRRKVWSPPAGVDPDPSDIFLIRGTAASIEHQVLDPFRAYPLRLVQEPTDLPEGLWLRADLFSQGSVRLLESPLA